MRVLHNRRGFTLLEAMITMFILMMATLVFAATMPAGHKCARQAQEYKTANAIAQQKMEQLRSLKYELITPSLLYSNGAVDSASGSPYSFTTVDQVSGKLAQGTGRLSITDAASDVRRIAITVSWVSSVQSIGRTVRLTSYIADRRTRKAN